jgi:hypothetical protein
MKMTTNHNSEETNALLKKVKKLMALATSPNEHEAKLAAQKAQEIILRHNLSIQSIEVETDYEEESLGTINSVRKEHSFILHILATHFFVKAYFNLVFAGYSRSEKKQFRKSIQIVGTPSNVAVARYVFSYLMDTYKTLWKNYHKVSGCAATSKYPYLWGVTEGIRDSLKEVQVKVETELGLVVIPDKGLIKFMDEKSLSTRKSSGIRRDSDAEAEGREHGKKVKIAKALDGGNSSSSGLALGYNK